jgi:hypothetical protein
MLDLNGTGLMCQALSAVTETRTQFFCVEVVPIGLRLSFVAAALAGMDQHVLVRCHSRV